MKSNELKELLERATKSSDPWASRVAFAIIQENSNDFAAELIRCRELLAGMVDSCSCNCGGFENGEFCRQPNCLRCGDARKYLSETEG